jgi:hypothetical protein
MYSHKLMSMILANALPRILHLSKFQTFKIDQYIWTKKIGKLILQIYMKIFKTQNIVHNYLKQFVKNLHIKFTIIMF